MTDDGRREELRITDPRALRALAHPARVRVVSTLFEGEELTATEAAHLCDLSPSAMSYHLRALERWGFVERAEATGDGRERPWRAVARGLTLLPEAYRGAGAAVGTTLLSVLVGGIEEGLARAAAEVSSGGEGGAVSRGRMWLTDEELRDVGEELVQMFRDFRDRTATDHPQGARAYDTYMLLLPREPMDADVSPTES